MKVILPPPPSRARILQGLYAFYETEKRAYLRTAIAEWAAFYQVKAPRIELRKLRKDGDLFVLGQTQEDNKITLWPPAMWKMQTDERPSARRPQRPFSFTASGYVRTILHELAHVLWYVDAERRADLYAARFVRQPTEKELT